MTKEEMLARIEEIGIIPAVRAGSTEDALFASEAVFASGIPVVEITMTTPGATEVITRLRSARSDVIVGAGTVFAIETARACLEAGASFLTSTGFDPEIVEFAREHGVAMFPGALTPSEIILAKKAEAPLIKVFPCVSLGGPAYIRALRGPFPDVKLIASGGVTQQTAASYIRAGSNVLGIGQDLLPAEAIRARNADWIQELSRRFIAMVKEGRNSRLGDGGER